MTDQPIDIRVELKDLLATVDGNVQITRDQMDAINDHLGVLWGKAHDAGDEQAMTLVQNTWDRVLSLVEQNSSLAFQVTGMGSIATAALEGERATRAALDELEDAIESGDEDHPKLHDFVLQIREDAADEYREWMEDEGWPEAMAEAYEEIRGEMVVKVRRLSGCSLPAANRLLAVVMGRRVQFTPDQSEIFAALLLSLEEQNDLERTRHAG